MLGGISYTNKAAPDPRPQAGSPALSNVLPVPAGLHQVNYRGAFAPGSQWADGWTALSKIGFLKEGSIQPPVQPEIAGAVGANGTDFVLSLATEAGRTYQLQSTTNLGASPIVWVNEGDPVVSSGAALNLSQPLVQATHKFFRVSVQ